MKVFILKKDEVMSELSKFGKVVVVEKREEGEQVVVEENRTLIVAKLNSKVIIEMLAGLGYDFVALKGFEKEELNIGINVPVVSTIKDVMQAENYETLKSMIEKVKAVGQMCGALGIFVGFVRKISDGKEVLRLEYEKYEEVYTNKLKEIEERLKKYPGIVDVKIYHKTGLLTPGEDIVYVVIMGKHRKDVWRPLEESMEIIKKELPIWKKEVFVDGEIWAHDRAR